MSATPPPFHGPRDPGDAWAVGPDGTRMWGRFGSAGLLAVDAVRGVLLQHRAVWSHHGGTWGIPGGARHQHEPAVDAALREAHEEAGVPLDALAPLFTSTLDLGFWTYTTAAARTVRDFEPAITDAESLEVAWIPFDAVETLPLHPHFAAAWPRLRRLVERRPVLVVDAANLVGSRPDGWWKDRPGAARRLLADLRRALDPGLPAELLRVPDELLPTGGDTVWPRTVVVLEGAARAGAAAGALDDGGPSRQPGQRWLDMAVEHAAGSGDDAIVERVRALLADTPEAAVTVTTSDRGLRERVEALGAHTLGVGTLLRLLG